MNFSQALVELKASKKVGRKGWNGKGMWIALGGTPVELEAAKFWNPHMRAFAEQNGGKATVDPYIVMKTAQNSVQMGWLASQADILADDWEVVE